MGRIKVLIVLITVNFMVAACGSSKLSLSEKLVPSEVAEDSSQEAGNQFEEEPLEVVEDVEDNLGSGWVTLREKVLANSDVPETALDNAFEYYDAHESKIRNKKYMTIFDISQFSGKRRMFIINLETGKVSQMQATHGKKSDTDHDGYATSFSNTNGSNKSSLGFMLTAERYWGKNGTSMRLDGLESRNSRVRQRAIVVHGGSYVNASGNKIGRSLGCPAVSHDNIKWVIGVKKDFGPVAIFASYNVSKFDIFNGGIQYSF